MATAKRRRRRKKRKELNSSNGGSEGVVGLTASDGSLPSAGQVRAGRTRQASFGSFSSDGGWGGSVSDSALDDEELEEETFQKMNQLKAYTPPQGRKGGAVSPAKDDSPAKPVLNRSGELKREMQRRAWEEEEEEDTLSNAEDEMSDTKEHKEPPENLIDEASEEAVEMLVQDEGVGGEGEGPNVVLEHPTTEGLDFNSPSRGRTRLRSSSSGTLDTPVVEVKPAPIIISVRRTRARSQPPSKEAPDGQVCVLLPLLFTENENHNAN